MYLSVQDRHWQRHLKDTNLWEFGTGSGADAHAGGWQQSDKRPEHQFLRVKGGYLFGSIFYENKVPKLKFELKGVTGKTYFEKVFIR